MCPQINNRKVSTVNWKINALSQNLAYPTVFCITLSFPYPLAAAAVRCCNNEMLITHSRTLAAPPDPGRCSWYCNNTCSLIWTPAQIRPVPPLLALPVTDLPIDIEYILYLWTSPPGAHRYRVYTISMDLPTWGGLVSVGGIRLKFFLPVIIQGGNNAPNSAIIPQCNRLSTMI